MSVTPFEKPICVYKQGLKGELKSQAHSDQNELQANPVLIGKYDLPRVPPSSPHDRTGQQSSTPRSSVEDTKEDMEQNQISNCQHSTVPSLSNQNSMRITQKELDTREQPLSGSPETAYGNDNMEAFIDTHIRSAASGASESHSTSDIGQKNRNNDEKNDTLVNEEEHVEEEEEEEVTDIFKENGQNQETSKELNMFTKEDLFHDEPKNVPRENAIPRQDVSTEERSCLMEMYDNIIERNETKFHPSDHQRVVHIPKENGSYCHQLDMQRANMIHQPEWLKVPKTAKDAKTQAAKEEKRTEWEEIVTSLANTLPEEQRRKFINRLKSVHHGDIVGISKLLDEITTTPDKTEEELIELHLHGVNIHKESKLKISKGSRSEWFKLSKKLLSEAFSRPVCPVCIIVFSSNEESPKCSRIYGSVVHHTTSAEKMSVFSSMLHDDLLKKFKHTTFAEKMSVFSSMLHDDLLKKFKHTTFAEKMSVFSSMLHDDLLKKFKHTTFAEKMSVFSSMLHDDLLKKFKHTTFAEKMSVFSSMLHDDLLKKFKHTTFAEKMSVFSSMLHDDLLKKFKHTTFAEKMSVFSSMLHDDLLKKFKHTTFAEKMSVFSSMLHDDLLKKFKNIVGHLNFLHDITTASDKTERKLVEYTDVSSEERSSLMGKSDAVNKIIEKNPHFTGANVEKYGEVMKNETKRMMKSIDTLESVAFDLLGPERKRVFFDLLSHRLHQIESSATISDFIPNMTEHTDMQEVISFSVRELSMINRLTTLLVSCPDGERLRQRSQQEFISLIQTVVASTFNESTTRRPIFFMVDSEVFKKALEGISQDCANNPQPEERAVVRGVDNERQKGNGTSETIESRPVQCIYFPSDCRLFIYISKESGSYWDQLDMQRASRLNLTSPAVTNP